MTTEAEKESEKKARRSSPVEQTAPPYNSLVLPPSTENSQSPSDASRLKFLDEFGTLFNASIHTDITIKTKDGNDLLAHRCILALRAPYIFANESAETPNTVRIKQVHSTATVWRLLRWCYTGDYPYDLPTDCLWDDPEGVMRHVKVYFLAAALKIEDLQALLAAKFSQWWAVSGQWHRWRFCCALKEIYANTNSREDVLRKAVLETAWRKHDDLLYEPIYRKVMWEVEGYAAELAWNYLRK